MTQNKFRERMHLPALRSREGFEHARLEVDVGSTGFWEGNEFRLSYEFSITATKVFKFSCEVDFILQVQRVTCDQDGIKISAYRAAQGTEGGIYSENISFVANNIMSDVPVVTSRTTITSGGTFTPTVGESPVEVLRVRSSNATAQKVTVSPDAGDERGLAAGNYYLVAEILSGTNPQGVYDLKWEERPNPS